MNTSLEKMKKFSTIIDPNLYENLAVVLAIVDYERPGLTRGASMEFLAFIAGMGPERFDASVQELVHKRLLKRVGPDEAVSFDMEGLLRAIERNTPDEGS